MIKHLHFKLSSVLLYLLFLLSYSTFAQIGIGTTTPRGAFDIVSNTQGFVPPQVALTTITAAAPVVNPQGGAIVAGTIVYNTATAGVSPNNVIPGYYYWSGSLWVSLSGGPGSNEWVRTGNSGTSATTNFVGTTDAVDFVTRTNNIERMRVTSAGNVGVGLNNPNGRLHLYEPTGTILNANQGTLILDHGNNGGQSSILFRSAGNIGSDFGYIRYSDDGSGNGSTGENSLLEIGIQNDGINELLYQDDIALMPSGNVGIGTVAPTQKLHVIGNILASGTITPSDKRYKENIKTLEGSLENVLKMRGVSYEMKREYKDKGFGQGTQIGLIAQEVEQVYPELVLTGQDGYKAVDYSKLTPILLQAIKEQQLQINALLSRLEKLEK